MLKTLGISFFLIFIVSLAVYAYLPFTRPMVSPVGKQPVMPRPLLSYTFGNLQHMKFPARPLKIGKTTTQTGDTISRLFYFSSPKVPGSTSYDTVSGLMNLPKKPGKYPIIVMLRGFVPKETYQPGIGTQRAGEVFAQNGFITLAPDFLGYGESSPSADSYEGRFQTYTTILTLLSSLPNVNIALDEGESGSIQADTTRIGLWGHSNGGHIALSILAITGASYPTVLWAPVSKSFPYSILYYTDEYDDQGKLMRKSLANFERAYDTDLFSPAAYYHWIKAPVALYQGGADEEVPVWWSDELAETLKKNGVEVRYAVYPGSDHNLQPTGWSAAVNTSVSFYESHF